jgi:hypothetical protein
MDEGCVKDLFCGSQNDAMKVKARDVLMENLRQSCIYKIYYHKQCTDDQQCQNNIMTFWDYMSKFSETCADINNPVFTEKCANLVMESLYISKTETENCMSELINSSK